MFDRFFLQASGNLLQQVSRSFAEAGRRPQEEPLLVTAVLVAAVILGYLLWKKFGPGADRKQNAKQRQTITAILEQALTHRSRMDMNFHSGGEVRQTVSCALHGISATEITMEMPLGVTPSEHWRDRLMDCFFRVPRPGKAPYFYTFSAPVLRSFRSGGIDYLVLAFPQKVALGQKRRHLRLDVPPEDIKDLRVWVTENGASPFNSEEEAWPAPTAAHAPSAGGMRVLDISGGGIRLAFSPEQYRRLEEFTVRDPLLFMRLELAAVDDIEYPPCFVAARLRTSTRDVDNGTLMLGYEFVEYLDQKTASPGWIKTDPRHGVDDLATWVFKRHLELYREREIV